MTPPTTCTPPTAARRAPLLALAMVATATFLTLAGSITAQTPAVPPTEPAPVEPLPTEPLAEPTVATVEDAAEPEGLRIVAAVDVDPADLLWEWRIVAVMADTPNDPAFVRQMRDIAERANDLFDRDVVVIVDSDRNSGSILRQQLRPRGFMLAIIDKDGEVKQRRPAPRDVREISAAIDRFPLRMQEMLERAPSGR